MAKLGIESEVLQPLVDELNVAINALVKMSDIEGKEGELTLKMKITMHTERDYEDGKVKSEWKEPCFAWDIIRKVKEGKYKTSANAGPGFMITYDTDGVPYVDKATHEQVSMFDGPVEKATKESNDKI